MFQRLTPAVRSILIINVAVFVVTSLTGLGEDLKDFASLHAIQSSNFSPTQFLTYMFLHADLRHLFGNMLLMFFLGSWVESVWGPQRFLVFYLACGLGAGLIYSGIRYVEVNKMESEYQLMVENPTSTKAYRFLRDYQGQQLINSNGFEIVDQFEQNPTNISYQKQTLQVVEYVRDFQRNNTKMLGASGAIYGILLALGMLFPNRQVMLLIPPIPIKIKYLVLALGVMAYFGALAKSPGDNVAHNAHLAGMLIAFLLIKFAKFGGE